MTALSDDPRDKLQAMLSHNGPGPDNDDLGAGYRHACAEWFASLSGHDKSMAAWVVEVYDDGNKIAQAARVSLEKETLRCATAFQAYRRLCPPFLRRC